MSNWKTILTILVIAILLSVMVTRQHTGPWENHQIVGLAMLIPGFLLWVLARLQLGTSFSVTPQARALVTHGLYAKIRNPIYVFGSLFIAGVFVFIGIYWLLLLLLIIVPMQITRARKEARVLEQAFGEPYREYKKKTWF